VCFGYVKLLDAALNIGVTEILKSKAPAIKICRSLTETGEEDVLLA
jgi:hypothetical protein